MSIRVGLGFDVHAFSDDPTRVLTLGGVVFDGAPGPASATATPTSWPTPAPTRCSAPPGWATSASTSPTPTPAGPAPTASLLLTEVSTRVRAEGWEPVNVDCAVVLEAPKVAPQPGRDAAPTDRWRSGAPVAVKANRAEGLGAIGRGEGIACYAVALVEAR